MQTDECNTIPSNAVCRRGEWLRQKGFKEASWYSSPWQRLLSHKTKLRTVQDPLIRSLTRKKAASCNMHPDVLAKVELTNVGNKQNLSERKADLIPIKRQKQCDEGRFQVLEYFFAMPKMRRLPGWRYYLMTERLIRMTQTPTFWNICVILTRGTK